MDAARIAGSMAGFMMENSVKISVMGKELLYGPTVPCIQGTLIMDIEKGMVNTRSPMVDIISEVGSMDDTMDLEVRCHVVPVRPVLRVVYADMFLFTFAFIVFRMSLGGWTHVQGRVASRNVARPRS